MKYRIRTQQFGKDTLYTVSLERTHPFIPLADRQAPFDVPHTRWLKGGKAPKSDWMRQRSYKAEVALCNSEQKRFDDFRDVAEYLGSLMATEWFARRWPTFNLLKVNYQSGSRNAHAGPRLVTSTGVHEGSMTLSRWAIGSTLRGRKDGGEAVVLHELGHALCPREHEHSPLWARTYLELVHFRMGAAAAALLKAGFDERGVRYRPYRQLTEAQRQALRERFIARGLNRKSGSDTVAHQGVSAQC